MSGAMTVSTIILWVVVIVLALVVVALARQVDPALTTIRQPLVRMAERAAEMLIRGTGGDTDAISAESVPATIKIRESTGPAPGC